MNPEQLDIAILLALRDGRLSLSELADRTKQDARFILRRLHVLQREGHVIGDQGETCVVYWLTSAKAADVGAVKVPRKYTKKPKPDTPRVRPGPRQESEIEASEKSRSILKKAIIVRPAISIPELSVHPFPGCGGPMIVIQSREPEKEGPPDSVYVLPRDVPGLIAALQELATE